MPARGLSSPDPGLVDASLIACALETTLTGTHPGWKLVHTVKKVLRHGGSGFRDDSEPLVKFGTGALCACPPGTSVRNADAALPPPDRQRTLPAGVCSVASWTVSQRRTVFLRMSCQSSTYRPKTAIGTRAEMSREPRPASRVAIA